MQPVEIRGPDLGHRRLIRRPDLGARCLVRTSHLCLSPPPLAHAPSLPSPSPRSSTQPASSGARAPLLLLPLRVLLLLLLLTPGCPRLTPPRPRPIPRRVLVL
eukprot:2355189-Rhodomonas_salina.1